MSKYYREEDIVNMMEQGFSLDIDGDKAYVIHELLPSLQTIQVSEDCISRKWLEEHKEVISYKNEWYETEIDEFVSWENIEDAPSVVPKAPSEDCISRLQVLELINAMIAVDSTNAKVYAKVFSQIKDAPSVVPKRAEGEWRGEHKMPDMPRYEWYRCSECRFLSKSVVNYCPNCGAKMKGAENEN